MVGDVGRTPRIPLGLKNRPFSLSEARAAGLSLSMLRGKSWQRVGARLYRWVGLGDDTWALIDAVRRTLPASAIFVGRTAAWMHRLDVQPANPVQVAVAELESRAGLEVRHSDVSGETMEIRGFRATNLNRTLLDLCAWLPAVEALVILDMAFLGGLTEPQALRRYADSVACRAGAARLRSLAMIAAPAQSPMETRLRWLLIKGGLPMPEVQTDLYADDCEFVGCADLYYPAARLVIEFDGGNHRERMVSDDRRQNKILNAGYRILRFTTADVRGRPSTILAQVKAAL